MPDRNGKIFYTSITSLSHISKGGGAAQAAQGRHGPGPLRRGVLQHSRRLPRLLHPKAQPGGQPLTPAARGHISKGADTPPRPRALSNKTKSRTRLRSGFFIHRSSMDAAALRLAPKAKSKPSAAGSIWKGWQGSGRMTSFLPQAQKDVGAKRALLRRGLC